MSKLGKIISRALAVIPAAGAPPNDWLSYARFLYPFAISVGAVLAVIMLIIAGLQMMTASESQRAAAKEKIQNALLGLLLLVGIYIILNTINPDLLDLKINTSRIRVIITGQGGLPSDFQITTKEEWAKQKPSSEIEQKTKENIVKNNDKVIGATNKTDLEKAISKDQGKQVTLSPRELKDLATAACKKSGGFGVIQNPANASEYICIKQ